MMNACPRWSILAVPVLAALGCSDPVPLPAQGAISLSIQNKEASCPESGFTYEVGAPKPPSVSSPGDSVIDGESGAAISCSVRGKGTFTFSGSLHGVTLDSKHYPITVNFTNGTVDATGKGTASLSVYTPVLAGNFNSSEPCTVQVVGGQIKGGSMWATFTCPSITTAPSGKCQIGTSVIVFENCDGS